MIRNVSVTVSFEILFLLLFIIIITIIIIIIILLHRRVVFTLTLKIHSLD